MNQVQFYSFVVIFILIFPLISPQPYLNVIRKSLQDGLLKIPCNYSLQGKTILYDLSALFNNDAQINRITVSGWFFFKGQYAVDYCLLSLHDNATKLASISYNSDQHYIVLQALSKNLQTSNAAYLNQWNFIIFDILFDTTHITSQGMIKMMQPTLSNASFNQVQDSHSLTSPLLLSQFQLNIGNPPRSLTLDPSCSIIKGLMVQINSDFNLNSLSQVTDYIIKQPAQLLSHFDLYYTSRNTGYLISDKGSLYQKVALSKSNYNQDPSVFNNGDFFFTALYPLNTQNEYIISFFLKMLTLPTSDCLIATIMNDSFLIYLYVNQSILKVQYSTDPLYTIDMFSLGWNYIMIIFNFQSINQFSLYIDGKSSFINFPVNTYQTFLRFYFSPACSLQLNHLRIYQGSGFYSTDLCLKQSFDGSCFHCKGGYIQDFQNNMQCVLQDLENKGTIINGAKDWNPPRNECLFNMVNDPTQQNQCVCIVGFYFDGNLCQKCPSYCVYCTSLSTCNSQRDPSGICLNPAFFDDGINCLEPLFTIPNQVNQRVIFQKPEFGASCTNLGSNLSDFKFYSTFYSGETIFFSFGFYRQSLLNPFTQGTIATVTSNSQTILTIGLFYSNPIYKIGFTIYLGSTQQIRFSLSDSVWIGYWSDNNKHIFLINTNGINYYSEYVQQTQYSQNIEFTIGRFTGIPSTADATSNCFTLGTIPFTFIKNIPYPREGGINQMFTLMADDVNIIVQYKFDSTQSGFTTNLLNSVPASFINSKLVFTSTLTQYNAIQGFGLTKQVNAYIDLFNNWGNLGFITFSCNIELDNSSVETIVQFLQIQYSDSNNNLTFYLDIDYTLQIIRIIMCWLKGCQSTKSATLFFNQSNFMLIIARDQSMQQDIQFEKVLEVDFVCNQMKETLLISYAYSKIGIAQIKLATMTSYQFLIYLDNIRIYQSYGFVYYDYNKENSCFISFNVAQPFCVRLKKDYLYYGNTIVSKQQCLLIAAQANQTFLINEKDQLCQIHQANSYPESLCKMGKYINGVFTCVECKDKYADPNKQCLKCLESYYFNSIQKQCVQCSPICKNCVGSAQNCTECFSANQSPPSCNCIFENYYLDSNYQCIQCSSKCKTCINDSGQCSSCSSPLKTLPSCDCPSGYSSIGQDCVQQFSCSSKCQTCTGSPSNCIQCSLNRINPPSCPCAYGFEENSNGDCLLCSSNTYYEIVTKQCIKCSSFCLECDLTQCKKCQLGLQQIGTDCVCPEQLVSFQISPTEVICLKGMELVMQTNLQSNTYSIIFLFEQSLKAFDFSQLSSSEFNEIMSFYLPEINSQYYQFVNPIISNNQLSVQLKIFKSIHVSSGYVLIKKNKYFISKDSKWILKDQYINKMLSFKIGPFLLPNMGDPSLDNINNQLKSFQNSNSNIFSIINQMQVLFYLLNTLQPISVFLLLNANYPPTLYKFYQIVGTFVFPYVPNYQSTDYNNNNFSLFGVKLDKADNKSPMFGNYQKLGYHLSFLVNIPIVVIKYSVIFLILFLIFCVQIIKPTIKQKLSSVNTIIIQRLNADLESSLLIIMTSIFIQFQEFEQSSFLYRIGLYIALLFILLQIGLFYLNYNNVMNLSTNQSDESGLYLERIQDKSSKLQRSYFLLQLLKKYLYISIVYFFFNYPIFTCIFNGTLLFISSLSLLKFKVYDNKLSKMIKFLGDFLLSIVWFLHIAIIRMESLFKSQTVIDSTLLEKYISLGVAILIILIIINIIFLITLFITIYNEIKQSIIKKKISEGKVRISIQKIKTRSINELEHKF